MIQNDTIANLVEKIPSNDNGQAEESEIVALKERIVILEAETSGDPRILQKEGNLKDRKPRKPLNCEECDQEFSRNCDLEKHLESRDKQKDFKCTMLEGIFYFFKSIVTTQNSCPFSS